MMRFQRLAAFVLWLFLIGSVSAQEPELEFVNVAGYHDGTFGHIIGVVRNNADYPMEFVQIVSSVYDDQGNYIDNGFTYTMLDVLLPGEWSPFSLTLLNAPDFARFDYTAQWDRTSRTPNRAVEVVNHRGHSEGMFYQVSGQVRNTDSVPLEFVQIAVAAYDANDEIVGVGFTYTTLDVLQPGATSPFQLTVLNSIRPISRYELVVQGDPR